MALSDDPVCREVLHGRVEWVETDAAGIYHYTNALRWVEAAEAALFRRHGILDLWHGMVRRQVVIELKHPLAFDDPYVVELHPERVGRTSITWSFTVTSGGMLCASGSVGCVHVDEDFVPAPLPPAVLEMLREGSGDDR